MSLNRTDEVGVRKLVVMLEKDELKRGEMWRCRDFQAWHR